MTPTPLISVVTPVYNGAQELTETIESILAQTGCDLEYLLIDDGSTDGSAAALDEWAARDPRVVVVHQPNAGLTRALVQACRLARGEFIARQDIGDVSLPGRLAAQVNLLQREPRLAFVACLHDLVGPRGEPLSDSALATSTNSLQNRDGANVPSPHHGSVMFRKAAYFKAGEYRPEFYFAQDADLWSRLVEQGDLAYVPEVLYRVKFELGSITARHRHAQEQLRLLVEEGTALRRAGQSEAATLAKAAAIRPGAVSGRGTERRPDPRVAAAYFVGSCLAQRGDPRARGYFLQALRLQPLHFRSWYKLAASVLGTKTDRAGTEGGHPVKSSLRVMILCCDGIAQRHLMQRAAEEFTLAGIVLQAAVPEQRSLSSRLRRYRDPRVLLRHVAARLLLKPYERRAESLARQFFHRGGAAPRIPEAIPRLVTNDINSAETARFIHDTTPNIILVSGTNLLREPILSLLPEIRLGIINLHTGLSPYSRGGNCNLYMLLEGHPEMVGVTVHHIDRGIDSGDIIVTSQVPMEAGDSMEMIDARSLHLGIELLLRAAHQLEEGSAARVKQWEEGKLFLRRTGYVYEPYHRLLVNRALDRGLLRGYLADRPARDAAIRLVQERAP